MALSGKPRERGTARGESPARRLAHPQAQPEQAPSGRMQPIQSSTINLTRKKATSRENWIKEQQNPTYIWSYLRLALLTFHLFQTRGERSTPWALPTALLLLTP